MSESLDNRNKGELWTVGDVLSAMSGEGAATMPDYVMRMVRDVQAWLAGALLDENRGDLLDIATGSADRGYSTDIDYLFSQLEWSFAYADVIPAVHEIAGREDAVVLSVGPVVLDEGMRMMVDHAALFAAGHCKRVWIISDTWIMGDILSYMPHIRVLAARGIELRFLLVTPWGWSEIPWNTQR